VRAVALAAVKAAGKYAIAKTGDQRGHASHGVQGVGYGRLIYSTLPFRKRAQ
jgi:hypothetical protein